MMDWIERSRAEARARDAQLEATTEKKIQEAVEAERRAARALSEECRQVHSEGLERRLKEDLRQEIRQVRAVAAEEIAEIRAELTSSHESVAAQVVGVAFPPQGTPLTFAPLGGVSVVS